MLRSLYSGISGLHAHQQMIDVTGNNIANVNTVGYKTQSVEFQDTLSQMVGAAGSPQGTMGGTNPSQVGLGVRVSGINSNFSQGSAQTTGKSGDMMVQGDGFFITRQGNEQMYTRAGSFSFDANGTLVTSTGQPVQGWTAVDGKVTASGQPGDIKMPLGATIPPAATKSITLKGNLTSDFPENKLATEDVVSIPVKVFDKEGATHTVTAKFTRAIDPNRASGDTPDTTWDVALYDQDGVAIPGADGELDLTNGKAIVSATDSPAAGELDKDGNMKLGDYQVNMADITMYSGQSDARVFSTDGQTAGALTSLAYTVSDTGEITGVYSNGLKQTLGQVAMATFKNPEGLEKVGNSTYRSTVNSGYAQVGQPASAGMGQVISGALEMSNVDLAQEFTNLVVAQRGFQANSKIITTSDEILQELVSMKR
ncbi:flagellar hook protein FlgE [Actinoplanes cyaneus]|uniref:Flagellar hook protein FlgE n=1 Tax=Actinoplanes cyaneus TaxID=52696 RepID=A0A919IR22_9ACTN|nr:flagellar hook protein FlgE [Actinoplanes cyaneus]MCW2138573.1 flagellar hook protein FlgE [Actinoplanes cyaneus]GID66535.1 flagellar hook protein FlgE [Actinoplanes cyaneus]